MADENVNIILKADDQATAVLEAATAKIRAQDAALKGMSRSYQDTGRAIATMGRAFGGGWLVDAGQQLKELTEAGMKARDVMKGGGDAALALRLGVAGLASYLAAQGIVTITKAATETDKWAESMRKATEESHRLNAAQARTANDRFQNEIAGMSEAEKQRRKREIAADMEGAKRRLLQQEGELAGAKGETEFNWDIAGRGAGAFIHELRDVMGSNDTGRMARAQQEVDATKERLEMLREQWSILDQQTSLAAQQEAAEESRRKRGTEYMDAQRKFWSNDLPAAMQKNWQKQAAEAEKEKKREAEAAEALRRRTMAFQRQDADDAWERRTSRIEWMREQFGGKKPDVNNGPLAASESRLLSRNPGVDIAKQQLDTAKRMEAAQKAANASAKAAADSLAQIAAMLPGSLPSRAM